MKTIEHYTEERVNALYEAWKDSQEPQWVVFNKEGAKVYPFIERLNSFDNEGAQEVYSVTNKEVNFLGFLVNKDFVDYTDLTKSRLEIAKKANRMIMSHI